MDFRTNPPGTAPALDSGFSGAVLLRLAGERRRVMPGDVLPDGAARRFDIASITKLLTAIAVCRSVNAGRLALDDSLDRWVPEPVPFAAARVRIDHLLLHTSGLAEQGPDPATHDAAGWLAMAAPLGFPPGTRWGYSNIGYALLGVVLERALGRSYYASVAELVLRPAGMSSTSYDGPPGADRGDPFGYAWSTVDDLERLVDALVERRLLDDALTRRVLGGGVATGEPGREAGFGMFLDRAGTLAISTTSGAGTAASAWLDVVPERGYLCIVLSDQPKPAAHRVGAELRAHYLSGSTGRAA